MIAILCVTLNRNLVLFIRKILLKNFEKKLIFIFNKIIINAIFLENDIYLWQNYYSH